MRWNVKLYKDGDLRTVHKFLFLPKRIGDETRWLESARINQEFCEPYLVGVMEPPYFIDREWAKDGEQ